MHYAGRFEDAEHFFSKSEQTERPLAPNISVLARVSGFKYCDLLLGRGAWRAAIDRANVTLAVARDHQWPLCIALDTLTLARAHLGLALEKACQEQRPPLQSRETRIARAQLNAAIDELRTAGLFDFILRGLLVRTAFWRAVADWPNALRDIYEIEEGVELSAMRLIRCDIALERARLAFARVEAFAPLNSLIEDGSPKPETPSDPEIKTLMHEAEKQISVAADYIEKCNYHRRDQELAELQAVLRGECKFANLPPRV